MKQMHNKQGLWRANTPQGEIDSSQINKFTGYLEIFDLCCKVTINKDKVESIWGPHFR